MGGGVEVRGKSMGWRDGGERNRREGKREERGRASF